MVASSARGTDERTGGQADARTSGRVTAYGNGDFFVTWDPSGPTLQSGAPAGTRETLSIDGCKGCRGVVELHYLTDWPVSQVIKSTLGPKPWLEHTL